MGMLKKVTEDLKVTVVLSKARILSGTSRYCSHALVLPKLFSPVFGTPKELEDFCTYASKAQPSVPTKKPGMHILEHCSDLLAKNTLDKLMEQDESASRSESGATGISESSKSLGTDVTQTSTGKTSHHTTAKAAVKMPHLAHLGSFADEIVSPFKRAEKGLNKEKEKGDTRNIFYQIYVLTSFEIRRGFKDSITVYRLIETIGIGTFTGIVWLQKGSQETQTALGETIGLLFFTTALWTVPPVFQALSQTPGILALASHEFLGGLYNLVAFVVSMQIATMFTLATVWPPYWQFISYAFAHVGADVPSMLKMNAILVINVVTMRMLGLFLALAVPGAATNVVIANLFAQLCMLTNGFYSTLPAWFQPITVISIPRYTLKALLKLEFSWKDGFLSQPMSGNPAWGMPTRYTPAQLTGVFLAMEQREMGVMKSFEDSDITPEVIRILMFAAFASIGFTMLLLVKIRQGESSRAKYDASEFQVTDATKWLPDAIVKDASPASMVSDQPTAVSLLTSHSLAEELEILKEEERVSRTKRRVDV
jgi:hypothetical protein